MEFLRYRSNAWGQQVLEGVSWDFIWVFVAASLAFIVFHAVYARWRNKPRKENVPED